MSQNSKNVTFLEDLPDIEYQENYPQNVRKFIRPTTKGNVYSGVEPDFSKPPEIPPPASLVNNSNHQEYQQQRLQENFSGMNCMDIANHVKNCPICTKFYDNDKTIYIVIIVVLAIVAVLLLKRVLEH